MSTNDIIEDPIISALCNAIAVEQLRSTGISPPQHSQHSQHSQPMHLQPAPLNLQECFECKGEVDPIEEAFRRVYVDKTLEVPESRLVDQSKWSHVSCHSLAVNQLSDLEWELWEERAAIMEYDGGLPREVADSRALMIVLSYRRRHLEW